MGLLGLIFRLGTGEFQPGDSLALSEEPCPREQGSPAGIMMKRLHFSSVVLLGDSFQIYRRVVAIA